jgi:hypothetical protein
MTPKMAWSIVALFGLSLVLAQGQPANRSSEIGRYQIVTVPGNNNENAQAFKIDTVTGRTWIKSIDKSNALAWAVLSDAKTQ